MKFRESRNDTMTHRGKLVFTVLGAVTELERNLIVERLRAGLRHAKAKGKRLGRPKKKSAYTGQILSLREIVRHDSPAALTR